MTAVVGILNKQAVAIAADSAVTIGGSNGNKIFNKANKLFTLSKHHPVGIMIYNSASFMGTPWETIIKVYRAQLGNKSFKKVSDYQKDFIEFIRKNKFYSNDQTQLNYLEGFSLNIINSVINDIAKINPVLIKNPTPSNQTKLLKEIELHFNNLISSFSKYEACDELKDYSFESFDTYSSTFIQKLIKLRFTDNGITISEALGLIIQKAIYAILLAKESNSNFTGLIFTGFGEEEIYPQLIPIIISLAVNNKLRYYIDKEKKVSISHEQPSVVSPFAQTDVIDTILSGIDPFLDDIYLNNFNALLNKYNQTIIDNIGDQNPLLVEQIKNLDTRAVAKQFNMLNQRIKIENYIIPLMNAVSTLSKDDLAEMAESLIYLTYLKRRITFAEESVGGPVDVAIISKGDGFIWIKRKHYFKPELNRHFFDNYFNH